MTGGVEGCTGRREEMRRMAVRGSWTAVAFLLAACAGAGGAEEEAVAEVERRPTYETRLDSESSDPDDFRLSEDDDGIRIQTGPAGIAWRSDDVVETGDFRLEATFRQFGAPTGYREAFGVFVGGLDLETVEQEYTYLLVRTSGDVLVKRRIGEVTETLLDWTPGDAVVRVVEEGDEPVNTLSVEVRGGTTHFLVNGVEVHTVPASRARPYGIAGVRVNHRLDVRVDRWTLSGGPLDS